jgi:hypothetical protein
MAMFGSPGAYHKPTTEQPMIMPALLIELATNPEQLQALQALAEDMWVVHYPGIIIHRQIRYMLD